MTRLLFRLAFAGMRTRLVACVLTLAVAGGAVSTIVLTLEVGASGQDPWRQTFDAANGAHVLAFAPSRSDARAVARIPGVTEHGEPTPVATATLRRDSDDDPVQLAGLVSPTVVNQPIVTEGAEPGPTGIMLERSLADALGIDVGTTVEIVANGRSTDLPVLGTAVLPSQSRYPRSTPGLAWVAPAMLERIEPDRSRWRWIEAVRLDDPTQAAAFTQQVAAERSPSADPAEALFFVTWQDQRDEALREAQPIQLILTMFTLLLLVVGFTVVGILVGARVTDQRREIAVLKAAGLTPRQIGVVFAIESLALGAGAAILGFGLGVLLAPQLAEPTAGTMVVAPTVVANPWHLLVAAGVVIPILSVSAFAAARRSTRSTRQALTDAGAAPPSNRLTRLVGRSHLPVSAEVGLKQLLARGRRPLLLGGAIALTGASVVVALSLQATLDAQPSGQASDIPDELPLLVYSLDAVLLVITTTTVVAVAYIMVRERVRDFGVLKAVGLTPRQLTTVLLSGYAVIAAAASLLSVPAGVGLYLALAEMASGTTEDAVVAPWRSLALVPVATLLVVMAASSIPARAAARIPVADALRYE
ncbi:MAG TPA: FtsX-like permease family protein [Nocardioidaceae bacterium]|nr:FtsX-like permease family protein [Nocardioidaceae bacterium]